MHAPELAVDELKRCVNELGMAGVEVCSVPRCLCVSCELRLKATHLTALLLLCDQIGTHINDMTLDDPRLFPIFKTGTFVDLTSHGGTMQLGAWQIPSPMFVCM